MCFELNDRELKALGEQYDAACEAMAKKLGVQPSQEISDEIALYLISEKVRTQRYSFLRLVE